MDFLPDQLFNAARSACTVVDNFTRISPAIDVRMSYVVETSWIHPNGSTATYGRPKQIRVDQGPEFISLWT
jgi:putative transposase